MSWFRPREEIEQRLLDRAVTRKLSQARPYQAMAAKLWRIGLGVLPAIRPVDLDGAGERYSLMSRHSAVWMLCADTFGAREIIILAMCKFSLMMRGKNIIPRRYKCL